MLNYGTGPKSFLYRLHKICGVEDVTPSWSWPERTCDTSRPATGRQPHPNESPGQSASFISSLITRLSWRASSIGGKEVEGEEEEKEEEEEEEEEEET